MQICIFIDLRMERGKGHLMTRHFAAVSVTTSWVFIFYFFLCVLVLQRNANYNARSAFLLAALPDHYNLLFLLLFFTGVGHGIVCRKGALCLIPIEKRNENTNQICKFP